MFGLEILDIGIGLIFIYLVLSLTCTAANELISSLTNARARLLGKGVRRLFEDAGFGAGFADGVVSHSLIRSLVEGRVPLFQRVRRRREATWPSYIPSRAFATAVLDLLAMKGRAGEGDAAAALAPVTLGEVEAGITKLLSPATGKHGADDPLAQTVRVLVDRAGRDLGKLEEEIGAWFDAAMERVSAWYKRRTQWVVLVVACIVAGASNADTVRIVESLSRDSALREALVAQAEAAAAGADTAASDSAAVLAIKADIEAIQALGVPLGWARDPIEKTWGWHLRKLAGLLLTAFALTLGAPFWFDLLKKAINIRSVGLTPQEAEDRRKRAAGSSAGNVSGGES